MATFTISSRKTNNRVAHVHAIYLWYVRDFYILLVFLHTPWYYVYIIQVEKGSDIMFLVTWIEGEEVNYRLVKKQELPAVMANLGQHAIIQKLAS